MGKFVKGVQSLFAGDAGQEAERKRLADEAARNRETQQIALDRQTQDLQNQQKTEDQQLGRGRAPRGRRLLLAATGEAGLPSTLG